MKLINLYHSGPVISFPPPQSDSFSFCWYRRRSYQRIVSACL